MRITEFLLARIAEDEADARSADGVTDKREDDWQDVTQPITVCRTLTDEAWATKYGFAYPHISRHSPARVLAACEAKRRILEGHGQPHECISLTGRGEHSVVDGQPWSLWETGPADPDKPCHVLRCLASEYANHPDYREEWRP